MEKIFNQKKLHYFFWTPLGSRVSIKISFLLQVHIKLYAPVSTTLAKLVEKFAAGVVDTDGKIATSIVDNGGAP
jgi:hypothetical protein